MIRLALTLTTGLAFFVLSCRASPPPPPANTRPPLNVPRCVTNLRALTPPDATRWVFARPRAMFDHPRLGRALARAFDDAGERALITRSRRWGYDLRTVDRALVAWEADATVTFGLSSFDTRRMVDLLWERLLPPRRRGEAGVGVTRVEGVLERDPVALAVHAACGLVAYAEVDTRKVDRVVLAPDTDASVTAGDPDAMLVWHQRGVPDAMRRATTEALFDRVADTEVTLDASDAGLRVRVRLEGEIPADSAARLRRALDVLITSPLGASCAADTWLDASHVTIAAREDAIEVSGEAPWGALDALSDVLRGRVGDGPMH